MSILINPECRAGKHASCDGRGWDLEDDVETHCPCRCHYTLIPVNVPLDPGKRDRCDPKIGYHSDPHKGCILR